MNVSKEPIRVTDHAVLRYLERAMGLNIDIVRQHILAICGGAAAFGAISVRAEGLRFEIRDGKICTVTPDHLMPSRTSQGNSRRRVA